MQQSVDRSTRSRMRRSLLFVLCGFALVVVAVGLWAEGTGFRKDGSVGVADIGGPFRLQASTGNIVSSTDLKGAPFLIFFGFTRCPDVCPTTLADMSDLIDDLRKENKPIKAFFVTVDPERDSAATMADYLSSFGDKVVGLTGSPDQIAAAERAYRVFAQKVPLPDGDYTMNHSATVYVMGRDGTLQGTISPDEGRDIELAKVRRAWS